MVLPLNAWIFWDLSLCAAIAAILIFGQRLRASLNAALILAPLDELPPTLPSLAVVIPAYNEDINLRACVESVLRSQLPSSTLLQVWIADDESSDRTPEIAQALALEDDRVHVLRVSPRPQDQIWRGKNWACASVTALLPETDYWLFIDADVRLEPGAIAAALAAAEADQTDLLTCPPEILCGCLGEWLVQPMMMSIIAIGSNFKAVNDPALPDYAFAAGPFMLFRRTTYLAIGGHRAVADDPVEDIALARLIKTQHFKLNLQLGLGLIKVRMYQSFGALWEGWTKNYYLGCQRQVSAIVQSVVASLLVLSMPWLGCWVGTLMLFDALKTGQGLANGSVLVLSLVALVLQDVLRRTSAGRFQQEYRYAWLTWLSGVLVAAIAVASMIKTETGWGWTWRGRSLAVKPNLSQP
jgi:hypothetical protein